jgi:hypothetical protein
MALRFIRYQEMTGRMPSDRRNPGYQKMSCKAAADPSSASGDQEVQVLVRLDPDQMRSLEAWRRRHPERLTRTEAFRALVVLGLRKELADGHGGAASVQAAIVARGVHRARMRARKDPIAGRSPGRPVGTTKGVGQQLNVRLDGTVIDAVDAWRLRQPGKPNRPEALRQFMLMSVEPDAVGGYSMRGKVFMAMVALHLRRMRAPKPRADEQDTAFAV